jgi:uncharacterized integral membrane protein
MKNRTMASVIFLVILATLVIQLMSLSISPIDHLISTKYKVMDFSTTVKVNSLERSPKAADIITKKNEVNFVSESRNSLNVYIPLRSGSVPFLAYQFTDVKKNDEIKLVIRSSREVYFFKNNLITYTHRYETPVFYTEISNANLINKRGTKLIELNTEHQVRQDENRLNGRAFLTIFLLAFCSTGLGIFTRKKSGLDKSILLALSTKTKIQFLLVSICCYVILFTKWYFSEKDSVGARNLTPFGPSGPFFSDFYQIATLANFTSVYESSSTNYPPFGILLLKFFSNFSYLATFLMIVFFCAGVLIGNFKFLSKSGILDVLITLTSFPFLFAIARGNLDLLACAFVILAITAHKNEKSTWAVMFLSIAVALKLWPIIFILILLKKGFKDALLVGISTFVLSISSFFILGHQSFMLFLKVIFSALSSGNAGTSMEFQNTYSIKTLFVLFHMAINSPTPTSPDKSDFASALNFANGLYSAIILLLLLVFLIFIIKNTNELKYQFFFASSMALLISSPSYVYRGIILIYAFHLLYKEASSSANRINLKVFSIDSSRLKIYLWLLIFVPTSFYYFSEKAVSTSSLIVPLSLICLLFIYANESGGLREFRLFTTKSKESLTSFLAK